MTEQQITWVTELVTKGQSYWFYVSRAWKRVRLEVLKYFRYECQPCKRKGRYTRATVVHHRFRLDEYPQYALEKTVIINGVEHINLEAYCRDCHEEEHEHRHEAKPQLNEERW
jgi:5-methylcytosine-specific restriction endonuclease McrA